MNEALEFHDSSVSSVRAVDGDLVVAFSEAYVHRSVGEPGVSAGEGFVQPAELVFAGASWSGELGGAHGDLSDGFVVVSGTKHYLLRLPFDVGSPVSAQLVFVSGSTLQVSAASASCRTSGNARFVDRYAG